MKLWILGKTSLVVFLASIFSLYFLAFYFNVKINDILDIRATIVGDLRVSNTTKKILFWNTMFGDETFYMGKGNIFFDCPVNDCYATHDRGYMDLLMFDAVLFHGNELDLEDLPRERSSRQRYVFVNLESPANRPMIYHFYEDYFNLTMTYKLDSDIAWTYGTVRDVNTNQVVAPLRNTSWNSFHSRTGNTGKKLDREYRSKKKAVIWFVSNCEAKSGREEYATELSKHITVDVYGKCGSYSCSRSKDCFADIAEPEYFFYLSFENSLCEDYVTEKLYNALRYNVVPIVYGGANYSIFVPPRSYIHVLDFDSPEKLAEYLKWLMKNPHEYRKYFEWKKYYRIDGSIRRATCNLCKFLHEEPQRRPYNVLLDWYSLEKCPLQKFIQNGAKYVTGAMLKNQDRYAVL